MPLNYETMYNRTNLSPRYLDLRHMQNDKLLLTNPHKGWYYHYVDNGLYRPPYRDQIQPPYTDLLDAHIHHLYIRFDWREIEIEKGVYDWSPIDDIIGTFGPLGLKFSLRLCTFEGRGSITAIPGWVIDAGAKGFWAKNTFEPDYSDETFLSALDIFMAEFGKKYNGHPLVQFVDVGTFGTWGEGHTGFGCGKDGIQARYDAATIQKHIDLHLKHFPDTLVMLNDDIMGHLRPLDTRQSVKTDPATADEDGYCLGLNPKASSYIYDYCLARNMGFRDDSTCIPVLADRFGYNTLRAPSFFADFAKNAPVDIELEHYRLIHDDPKAPNFANGFRFYTALKETHATYAGFHGYLEPWLQDNRDLHDLCVNKLGYWYFIDGIEFPQLVSGTGSTVRLTLRNNGFAHAYHRYDLKLRLRGKNGSYILNTESPDNRTWESESTATEKIVVNLRKVPAGVYSFEIGMFEGNTPIKLGFDTEFDLGDGFYRMTETEVKSLSI